MFRQNQEKFRDRAADVNNAVFWWGIFQVSGTSLITIYKIYIYYLSHILLARYIDFGRKLTNSEFEDIFQRKKACLITVDIFKCLK